MLHLIETPRRRLVLVAFPLAVAAASSLAAPGAAGAASSSTTSTPPAPPSGGGAPGAGGVTSTPVSGTGAYTVSGGTASKSHTTITAGTANESGTLVKGSATLSLADVVISTSGQSSSSDDSSFYGLDAGVLAFTSGSISETGGSVTTSGNGANAVFAYGSSASITIAHTRIVATGQFAHGIMASGDGRITATGLTVSTSGASGAAVATDRGGGTIVVRGGRYTTTGRNSPGLYSTGTLTASGATFVAKGAEAVVVEGANSVSVTRSALTGSVNRGVMIYQSMSGDAQGSKGTFSESGGSLTARSGPLFFVTNTTGVITLSGVRTSEASGVLLNAAAATWGTSGSNGGTATLNASHQALSGDITVDAISNATVNLRNGSHLTGTVNSTRTAGRASLSMDTTSTWTVTGTSYITTLRDTSGISGSLVTNIVGNGHTVHYSASANPGLGGKTYTLTGGGELIAD